jgi:hypothetical protein
MHALNVPEIIGDAFFAKPAGVNAIKVDYLYNKIFSTLPFRLSFAEQFEMTCLAEIEKWFEPICSEISKFEGKTIEEGFYIGKPMTAYESVVVGITFNSEASDDIPHSMQSVLWGVKQKLDDEKKILENLHVNVVAACKTREQAKTMVDLLADHKMQAKAKMYILASSYGDLNFTAMAMPELDVDLALNYGEDFPDFSSKLINSINDEKSGLYLFYGAPGTGKSTYIKYLLSGVLKRKVAYIPVSLVDKLTHPDMVPLLMNNKDIVLVLEDAEKALLSREVSENSAIVSTILNLTDGFIGQALNITVMATFNTDKDKIDEALLRKGRLKMSYEFKKLNKHNCQQILDKLGMVGEIKEDMTLAEVYNYTQEPGYKEPEKRRVGFN